MMRYSPMLGLMQPNMPGQGFGRQDVGGGGGMPSVSAPAVASPDQAAAGPPPMQSNIPFPGQYGGANITPEMLRMARTGHPDYAFSMGNPRTMMSGPQVMAAYANPGVPPGGGFRGR